MLQLRSSINKTQQQLHTGPLGWGVILLVLAVYYFFFFLQARPGTPWSQFTLILICSIIPIFLSAWLKTYKGALLTWLLFQPVLILAALLSFGTTWAVPTHLILWLPICAVSFGIALALGYFRFVILRLSLALHELKEAHITIQKQALTDGLTDLPNHRAVMNQFQNELERARRYGRPLSVLFFDADRFKRVNDTHGHAAGDAVLFQIGERAASVLRGGDTLGRFGGEEFVVLLPEADVSEAKLVAERIRAAIATGAMATSEVEGGLTMTVSIGLASYPLDATSEHELLMQADEAMYMAKRLGRNQIHTAEEVRQMNADGEMMAFLQQQEQREAAEREDGFPAYLRETYTLRTIYSLMTLLERRDEGLSAHAHAVGDLATTIAQEMEIHNHEVVRIGMAALLHDIGKVAIPDQILQKTLRLSAQERALIEEHAELGAQVLEASPFLHDLQPLVHHHHERWDGCGYPDRLSGDDIPLGARIIAVAEAYDTLLRDHPYQTSRSLEEARAELRRCAGTQFDPQVVQALLAVLTRQSEPHYTLRSAF